MWASGHGNPQGPRLPEGPLGGRGFGWRSLSWWGFCCGSFRWSLCVCVVRGLRSISAAGNPLHTKHLYHLLPQTQTISGTTKASHQVPQPLVQVSCGTSLHQSSPQPPPIFITPCDQPKPTTKTHLSSLLGLCSDLPTLWSRCRGCSA